MTETLKHYLSEFFGRSAVDRKKGVSEENARKFSSALPSLVSATFNFAQLGLVVYVFRSDQALELIWIILSFVAGTTFSSYAARANYLSLSAMLVFGALLLVLVFSPEVWEQGSLYPIALCIVAGTSVSCALRAMRLKLGLRGSAKRPWKFLGFLLAGLFKPIVLLIIAVGLMFTFLVWRDDRICSGRPDLNDSEAGSVRHGLFVFSHHFHYSSYWYYVVYVLTSNFSVPVALVGPAFYFGWLLYYVLEKFTRSSFRTARFVVAFGHLVAVAAILGMMQSSHIAPYLMFWAISGLGAGSIFLLKSMPSAQKRKMPVNLNLFENLGQIGGVSAFLLLFQLGGATYSYYVAAVAGAFCTLIGIWCVICQDTRSRSLPSSTPEHS